VPRRQLHRYESIPNTVLAHVKTHTEFARATIDVVLGHRADGAPYSEINTLESMVFMNRGGEFTAHPLPRAAQLSAGFAAAVADYDNDGNEDVFLSQNLFHTRDDMPRLDGGRGLWLHGDGRGGFSAVPGHVTGVTVYGEQRGAALSDFDADGRVDLVVTQNDGRTRLFANRTERAGIRVRLDGSPANRAAIGSSIRIGYDDGTKGPRRDVQAGSGYWSQNSAVQVLGVAEERTPMRIEVIWPDGYTSSVPVTPGRIDYVIRRGR
jgi:hypothetical protein